MMAKILTGILSTYQVAAVVAESHHSLANSPEFVGFRLVIHCALVLCSGSGRKMEKI